MTPWHCWEEEEGAQRAGRAELGATEAALEAVVVVGAIAVVSPVTVLMLKAVSGQFQDLNGNRRQGLRA